MTDFPNNPDTKEAQEKIRQIQNDYKKHFVEQNNLNVYRNKSKSQSKEKQEEYKQLKEELEKKKPEIVSSILCALLVYEQTYTISETLRKNKKDQKEAEDIQRKLAGTGIEQGSILIYQLGFLRRLRKEGCLDKDIEEIILPFIDKLSINIMTLLTIGQSGNNHNIVIDEPTDIFISAKDSLEWIENNYPEQMKQFIEFANPDKS